MKRFSTYALALLVVIASGFTLSETARVGGSGGRRTVTMECGPGAYMVGASASGGKDSPISFNLLRRVKFSCRSFNGTTPGTTTSQTTEAVGDKSATSESTHGSGTCSGDKVITSLDLYAGFFIDKLDNIDCLSATQAQDFVHIGAGGFGGTRQGVNCPAAQALYKVEARVGDAIDSLKGYCRTFGTISALSVITQISSTVSPKPSAAAPVVIPVNSSKTFTFTISNYTSFNPLAQIGITAETDLLGGSAANPPEFKLELITPSGSVASTKSFSNTTTGVICAVKYQINANGTWKLKVTNLKANIGTMNVRSFDVFANP